jgi:hypothetical protein
MFASAVLLSSMTAWSQKKSGPSKASDSQSKPDKVFKGQIIVSTSTFPHRFKSDTQLIEHMRKVNAKTLHASEEGWDFEYMAFLSEPVSSLQASVTFYDITTPGKEKLVTSFTFYPQNGKDTIINGHAELNEEQGFEAEKRYKMTFSRAFGQKPLAETTFILKEKK